MSTEIANKGRTQNEEILVLTEYIYSNIKQNKT